MSRAFSSAIAPYVVASNSVGRVMRMVIYALLPAILLRVVFFGSGLLVQIVLAVTTAMLCELLALHLRRQPIKPFLLDGSAAITAILIALCLPPLAPWWLIVSGTAFAILLAKHVYGGLGANPFNPAMVGYAVLLVSFPADLTRWLPPDVAGPATTNLGFGDVLQTIFCGQLPDRWQWDAVTSPTPLNAIRTGLSMGHTMQETVSGPIFAAFGGHGWNWINAAILAGGVWLLSLRIIRWHAPVAMLCGLAIPAAAMSAIDPGRYPGPVFHLCAGAAMLGAFFIVTDPVSSATSHRGKLIYGAGIGFVTYVIRTWGGYPDGIAFAVLLMNLAVPLIDRFTVPRIYGHER